MNAKSKWLTEKDGNIVIPKTLDSQTFDSDGNSLAERLRGIDDTEVIQLPKVDPTLIVSDLNYSTEEQLTGKRWIDGKPIYQITITGTGNNSSGDNYKINNPINDLDVIANIDCTAKITSTVSAAAEVPNMQMSNGSILANYIQSENQFWLRQTQTSGNSVYEYKLTVLYTKTTDTKDSPVAISTLSKLPFELGIDENGNYGYIKVGADTVTPFKSDSNGLAYHIIQPFYESYVEVKLVN